MIGRVVQAAGDQFEIQFQVFDVLRGEQLLGYRQATQCRGFSPQQSSGGGSDL